MGANSHRPLLSETAARGEPVPESCPPEEVIAAYVSHKATPDERRLVEAHLTRCDECGELVAFLVRWGGEHVAESDYEVP